MINFKNKALIIGSVLAVAACGGFVYTTVGGNVTGFPGDTTDQSEVLRLADAGNFSQTLKMNGPFSFKVASNGAYKIRVVVQPNQVNCTITNGEGQMTSKAPVTNVGVDCKPNVRLGGSLAADTPIGTTISLGLSVLDLGAQDPKLPTAQSYLPFSTVTKILNPATPAIPAKDGKPAVPEVPQDNTFKFPNWIVDGRLYLATITSQPPAQVCSISSGGAGTAVVTKDISNSVQVHCQPGVPVRVNLTGLKTGLFLTLSNNANAAVLPEVVGDLLSMTASTPALVATDTTTVLASAPDKIHVATTIPEITTTYTYVAPFTKTVTSTLWDGTNKNTTTTVTTSHETQFNVSLLNGAPYSIKVKTAPVGQICSVVNGEGVAVLGSPIVPIVVNVNCI